MDSDIEKANHVIFVLKDLGSFLSHRRDLANFILSKGTKVSLVADLGKNETFENLESLTSVIHFPFSSATRNPWKLFFPTMRLIRFLGTNRLATVFSVTIPSVLMAGLICKFLRIRHVILFAGLGNIFYGPPSALRSFIRRFLKSVTRKSRTKVIAQNAYIRDYLLRNKYATMVDLIPGSGIDDAAYQGPERFTGDGPIRFLFMSRLLKEKGVVEYITAAQAVVALGHQADFIIAGRTDPLNPTSLSDHEINTLLKDQQSIKWIGHTRNVQGLLASVDIVCLPSYHEGLPRALLEGALMGCCLIASDIPGCTDIVLHEKTGILVKPKSSKSLEHAFISLINNPTKISKLAQDARMHVIQNFTNSTILPKYWKVISTD